MLDDLAVADQQKVVIGWYGSGDLGEECSHPLVAMAFAGRVILCRRTPVTPWRVARS